MNLSASSLTGTKVRNGSGDDLGKVEDLMIDTATGQVNYAVLSFGGILGIGDTLFAVPLQAMKVDTDDEELILDVPKDRLANAPGFDKDNWPLSSDPKWAKDVRSYYGL